MIFFNELSSLMGEENLMSRNLKYSFQGIYRFYYFFWFFLLFSFLFLVCVVSFPRYIQVVGIVVREEEYYVKVYLEDDQIVPLHSSILTWNQKSIPFEIVRISDSYYLNEFKYREVLLKFEIEEQKKIENNLLSLTFVLKSKTWMQTLQEFWRRFYL